MFVPATIVEGVLAQREVLVLVAAATSVGMAALLAWAGTEKLRDLTPTGEVAMHLGLSRRAARPAACVLAIVEVCIAFGLLLRPGSHLVAAGVIGLAAVFAGAGLLALLRGRRVRCNCVGSRGAGYLGRPQIVTLPVWIMAMLLVNSTLPDARPLEEGAGYAAVVMVTMALCRLPGALVALRRARADRITATEMVRWLA